MVRQSAANCGNPQCPRMRSWDWCNASVLPLAILGLHARLARWFARVRRSHSIAVALMHGHNVPRSGILPGAVAPFFDCFRLVFAHRGYAMCRFLTSLLLAGLLQAPSGSAAEVPRLAGRVNDYADILPSSDRAYLERILSAYEAETTHQVAVLTVRSLHGESIEAFSLRVTNAWGLGQKGLNNGVLVTLAPAEHAVRIELGTGMSRYVSDAEAKRIIDETMVPAFRVGDMKGGLRRGVDRLLQACRAYKVSRRAQ